MIDFMDGSEMFFALFLPAILQKEWGLDERTVEMMGAAFFVGAFVGNVITGFFSDILGRKTTMLMGNLAVFI